MKKNRPAPVFKNYQIIMMNPRTQISYVIKFPHSQDYSV